MLTIGPNTRIYLAVGTTDLRAGFEKLAILAQSLFAHEARSGHLFLFCNGARTRVKVLGWDGSGLWLCVKRLERGSFAWPTAMPVSVPTGTGGGVKETAIGLSAAELTLLLGGIDLTQTKQRRWWGREVMK